MAAKATQEKPITHHGNEVRGHNISEITKWSLKNRPTTSHGAEVKDQNIAETPWRWGERPGPNPQPTSHQYSWDHKMECGQRLATCIYASNSGLKSLWCFHWFCTSSIYLLTLFLNSCYCKITTKCCNIWNILLYHKFRVPGSQRWPVIVLIDSL